MKVINIDLLKNFYNKLSNIFAKKTDIKSVNINNNLTTTTSGSALDATQGKALDDKITDLKKSVSDGKRLVANAITAKGVSTATTATFSTMASNIRNLNTSVFDISNIKSFVFCYNLYDGYRERRVIKDSSMWGNLRKDSYCEYAEYTPSTIFPKGVGLYLIIYQEYRSSSQSSNVYGQIVKGAMFIRINSLSPRFTFNVIKAIDMGYNDIESYFSFMAPYLNMYYCGN